MTDECGEYCQPPLQTEEGGAAVDYAQVAENQTLTGDQQTEICKLTAGQSANVHWKCVRRFRLTASYFGRIVSRRETTPPDNLLKSMLYPKFDISHLPAVRFGNQNEPDAVRQYLAKLAGRNIQVSEAGFYVCCQQGLGFLGASPDRLVKDFDSKTSYIMEVKSFCDFDPDIRTLAQLAWKRGGRLCCRLDAASGRWEIDKKSSCYHQILGQMAVVGVCFCDLVLSFKGEIAVARVFYDPDAWAEDCEKLKRFYVDAFLPEVHSGKIKKTMLP